MMLRNQLGALLICLSAPDVAAAAAAGGSSAAGAGSAEWQQFAEEPNGDVYFYDPTRVERRGTTVRRVWIGIRYKTSVMGASSFRSLSEIDCSEMTEQILQSTFFTDKQWTRPAMKTDMNEKPKTPFAAGSARDRLAGILCD